METLPGIAEVAERIRQGQIRPAELVERCLARIDRMEGRIHAWVWVDREGARREAERLGSMAGCGQWLGPLHGIPIGIKDIVDVAGWPTEAGSPLLRGHVAEADAPVVARLRANGAILLGKTATTEFAFLDPAPTRNPWHLDHTPGGSSSGSAAAVAAGMCMAAIGSQTGGSIIRPAAFCGVAGLKPTFGKVDRRGVVPVSRHLDHVGPIARTVGDLAIMLSAMSGGEPLATAVPLAEAPVLHAIDAFFMDEADAEIREVTQAACDRLRRAGAELRRRPLPSSFDQVLRLHRVVMAVEAAEVHRDRFVRHADAYGPKISQLIREGFAVSPADYARALDHLERFRASVAADFGEGCVAVTPSTVTAAPAGLASTGDPKFNAPWSYAGLPTVTVPCGLTAERMPCGLQLIGPRGGESQLLLVAAWCERTLAFEARPAAEARPMSD